MFTRILWKALSKTFCLLAGVAICAGTPWNARAGPALYNASVHIRMWDRAVPYGALGSGKVLANSPAGDSYLKFWETEVGFTFGTFEFRHSLKHLINDGLMVIFFFVIGLEVKRELVLGELRDIRRAALPTPSDF